MGVAGRWTDRVFDFGFLIYFSEVEHFMTELRLGDIIDDHCVKCRRLTNHSIVSIVEAKAAKVRCRTCYHDHDYRHEQPPPSKKDLKKAELFKEVLASAAPPSAPEPAVPEAAPEEEPVAVGKKTRARAKRT